MANYLEDKGVTFASVKTRPIESDVQHTVSWRSTKKRRLNQPQSVGAKVRPLYGQLFPR